MLGLFISSFRDKDQLTVSGWWIAFGTVERNEAGRTATAETQIEQDGVYVIERSLGDGLDISRFGTSVREPTAFEVGETVALTENTAFTLNADGSYRWTSQVPFGYERGRRVFYVAATRQALPWRTKSRCSLAKVSASPSSTR